MDAAVLEAVRAAMADVAVPGPRDKVYKDECVYSFCSPESPGGLLTCLKTWQGVGARFLELHRRRTGSSLFYHEVQTRVPKLDDPEGAAAGTDARPTKLAIGGEDGFQVNQRTYDVETTSALVIMPDRQSVPLPCPELPEKVLQSIASIQAHEGSRKQGQVMAWEEDRQVSKYAQDLPQVPADRVISMTPGDWKCDFTGVTENLWLNLSTGRIGSGRQHFDGTGGNGSALRHYADTGSKYPLAVKLGTITPDSADVYSYAADEDDLVIDPLLKEHLAHWGIDQAKLEKTDKTMAELQVDLNIKFEYNAITEGGEELRAVTGAGLVGLSNLGNYCYMSSVLQALWGVPALAQTYVQRLEPLLQSADADVVMDFSAQFAKVGHVLVTGQTDKQVFAERAEREASDGATPAEVEANAVTPHRFKALIGKGHPDFGTSQQQDAFLFFSHLLDTLARNERTAAARLPSPADASPCSSLFMFNVETRTQCCTSGAVSYTTTPSCGLSLCVPLEAATNMQEVLEYKQREDQRRQMQAGSADAYITEANAPALTKDAAAEEPVVPVVPMEACVAAFAGESVLPDYFSPALGRQGRAVQTNRIVNFPPYLMVHMQRFFAAGASEKKLEVLIGMQHQLALESLRAKGLQPDERLQPEAPAAAPVQPVGPQPDPDIVSALFAFGAASENACKRAALAVKNSGPEAASNWLFEHMSDPSINDPLGEDHAGAAAPAGGASEPEPSAEALSMLQNFGFTDRQARAALAECDGNIERAGDWLLTCQPDLDNAVAQVEAKRKAEAPAAAATPMSTLDGEGKYELVAIISHIGSQTACGHYVAHVKKGGQWYMFNDEKVAASARLPIEHGFLYLFRRSDQPWS